MSDKLPVVIMAGGLGKRAESIDNTIPKSLIPIAGKPILQWEIECLVRQGFTDIILTVSHMAEKIEDYFGDGSEFGCSIEYFIEKQLLGNAGALYKLWSGGVLEGDFLLLNADSMFDVDFERMISFHRSRNALATLLTHPNNHPYDSGLIICKTEITSENIKSVGNHPISGYSDDTESGCVIQWLTKEDERPKWYKNRVNAGVHILNTELLSMTGIRADEVDEHQKVDLDRDVLKPMVSSARIFAYDSPEYVKDMGTPERFDQVCDDLVSGKVSLRNLRNKQKAIFLDRDGTINKYVGFLRNIDEFELIDGVVEAIKMINASGYLAIVITNQPVLSRGEVSIEELEEIHNKMETLLGQKGAFLDAIYYCPHHPDKGFDGEIGELKIECDCHKPKPGMLLQAAEDYNIDLNQSWMIGDSWRDVAAGKAAGVSTMLLNGNDSWVLNLDIDELENDYLPTHNGNNLIQAVEMIINKYK